MRVRNPSISHVYGDFEKGHGLIQMLRICYVGALYIIAPYVHPEGT